LFMEQTSFRIVSGCELKIFWANPGVAYILGKFRPSFSKKGKFSRESEKFMGPSASKPKFSPSWLKLHPQPICFHTQ
jgi:hypothetical protein